MKNPQPPMANGDPFCTWNHSQLQHVETELATEYPNLTPDLIDHAVALAQAALQPSEGTVRLLARARKNLTPSASLSAGGSFLRMSA